MTDTGIKLYGAQWCPDCRRSKQFLGEHRIPYDWIDITDNEKAIAFVEKVNEGKRRIPTLLFDDESVLVNPTNAELAEKLGLQTEAEMSFYDLIVIGSGPAGLTAALYGAREGMNVLVIERGGIGGQVSVTDKLDNFPGFPDGIQGEEFGNRLRRQAERFGVEILQAQEVSHLETDGNNHMVRTDAGDEYGAPAVLVTTGSNYRRLGVAGEDGLLGAGVHFCATCDGPFYKGKEVAVVGGGNSAAEEGLFLTRFVEKVTMLVRGDELRASPVIVEKVKEASGVEIRYGVEVASINGKNKLESLTIRDRKSGEESELHVDGVFVFIGQVPNSSWLPESIERDRYGFVVTSPTMETSAGGVFCAGDVRAGSTKQAASAAGEGAAAALMIREYLRAH